MYSHSILHPRLQHVQVALPCEPLNERARPAQLKVHELVVLAAQDEDSLAIKQRQGHVARVGPLEQVEERGGEERRGDGQRSQRWRERGRAVGEEGEEGGGADDGDPEGEAGLCLCARLHDRAR